ncbi:MULTISPECIES: class I SAM-dependent methyltransferase [Bacillus]|uniref:Methyltransferase domain-containing protein n=1 Tax=Bacillus pumilus TaxID=1408 RepID=A0AAE3WHV3_BACPU|nr:MULTISPECIES: class I SAM-dependent methyltransferase [Bacillus]AOC56461.1 SAM-dependent methyltransferase [Bacillus pumilus]MBR0585833.1 methyltransferase domain-containing protein [Bacillus pumilus DW2J2]MBR0617757.1 methyltransferase domain-containing protein [Bacillus pumilus]MBR0623710.1 methyltransferase domain-containing protein [Bacillus pumilus]MBU5260298.1 methyltransferase domain-containing protein [Bacillus pumilus]
MSDYVEMLAYFGVSSAHPGGIELTKTMLEHIKLTPDARILDAGCGTGQTAAYLGNIGYQVEAIDTHPLMIEKANLRFEREELPIRALQASIEQLPFPDEAFTLLISESVLSFTNLPAALAEIQRVLAPGSQMIANEAVLKAPLTPEELATVRDFYGFHSLFSLEEWKEQLKAAGFHDFRILSFDEHMVQEEPTEMELSEHIPPSLYETLQTHYDLIQAHRKQLSHILFECTV